MLYISLQKTSCVKQHTCDFTQQGFCERNFYFDKLASLKIFTWKLMLYISLQKTSGVKTTHMSFYTTRLWQNWILPN
jgi:hypothetical protein